MSHAACRVYEAAVAKGKEGMEEGRVGAGKRLILLMLAETPCLQKITTCCGGKVAVLIWSVMCNHSNAFLSIQMVK